MKKLRHYQAEAKDAVYKGLKNNITKQMLVMATGCGKTYTAVNIISPFKRKLWVTHTEELLEQSGIAFLKELVPNLDVQTMIDTHGGLTDYLKAVRSYSAFTDLGDNEIIKSIGIVKAEAFDIESDIVMASAQTLHRRLDKMQPDMFDAIVADECHLFMAKTFVKSLNYFQPKLLLGLTATPFRADGASLSDLFDELIYQYNIEDAIKDGYLCELDAIQVRTRMNLDNVRTTAGEFNQKDLNEAVDTEARNELIVQKYKEYCDGKPNIVFCVDVEHAKNVTNKFKENGYRTELLVGDESITPDRKAAINRFKSGESQILVNVMIATAGFDYPQIGCVTLACPTKSRTKFMQQLGRGTRTWPGVIDAFDTPQERVKAIKSSPKPHCTILDIVDTTNRHRLINTWTLDEGKRLEDRLFLTKEKKDKMIADRNAKTFEATSKYDKKINLFKIPDVVYSTSLRMKEPATYDQLNILAQNGYKILENDYTKADANYIISNFPASAKQISYLKWKNYDVTNAITYGQAQLAFKEITLREKKQKGNSNLPIDLNK